MFINAQQTCEGIDKIYFMPDVSEIPETYICFHKISIGCNVTDNNNSPLLNWKSSIKLVKVVIHDYGTFSLIKLFEHA